MTKKRFLIRFTLVLLCTTIAGRLLGLFYGESATNILYADWVSVVLGYAEDLLGCLRTTYLICAVAYGYWNFGLSFSNRHILLSGGLILFDMLSRLAVDLLQNNIAELVTVAVIWLALQLAYELVLCVLAWLTAQLLLHWRNTSSHPRAKDRYTLAAALRFSLLNGSLCPAQKKDMEVVIRFYAAHSFLLELRTEIGLTGEITPETPELHS